MRQFGGSAFSLLAVIGEPRPGGVQLFQPVIGGYRQFFPQSSEFLQFLAERAELYTQLRQAICDPFPRSQLRRGLAFQGAGLVAEQRTGPHLFQVGPAAVVALAAKPVELGDDIRELPFSLAQAPGDASLLFLGGRQGLLRLADLLFQPARTVLIAASCRRRRSISSSMSRLRVALVLDGGFRGGDPLAIGRGVCFHFADRRIQGVQTVLRLQRTGIEGLGLGDAAVSLTGQLGQFGRQSAQPLAEPPPIDQRCLGAEILQTVRELLVPPGLPGLKPHAPQAAVDLVDNIGKPQQILLHPLQAAKGFHLAGFEAADAGRLFEDHPAVLR